MPSARDNYAVVRISRETENPHVDIVGIYKKLSDASSCAEAAERQECFKVGSAVWVNLSDGGNFKGEILGRRVDFTADLGCPVCYHVCLEDNDRISQFRGKQLPKTWTTQCTYPLKHRLNKGVSGTPECLDVPVRYLESYGFGEEKDKPSFDIRRCESGRGGKIWASLYEASTTGWGDDDELPMVSFFTSQTAANAHSKKRFHKRLKHNQDLVKECGGYSDENSDDSGAKGRKRKEPFPHVPTNALFKGEFPHERRSKVFGKGLWKIDQRYTEGLYSSGLYVGLIRNWHGGHLDGCGNPEMEEITWTELHQARRTFTTSSDETALKKRPASASTEIRKRILKQKS